MYILEISIMKRGILSIRAAITSSTARIPMYIILAVIITAEKDLTALLN